MPSTSNQKKPLRFDTVVQDRGRLELKVPLRKGSKVTVFVLQDDEMMEKDLLNASTSSFDFWDNPLDDADWNNA